MKHSKFLQYLYSLRDEEALQTLFSNADEMMFHCDDIGNFEMCAELLDEVDLDKCSATLAIGFITILSPVEKHIPASYTNFYNRLKDYFDKTQPGRTKSLLQGLEPKFHAN